MTPRDRLANADPVDEMVTVLRETLGMNSLALYQPGCVQNEVTMLEALARGLLARGVVALAPDERETLALMEDLRKAVREWREAGIAYQALLDRGPVIPPDEPDFGPWERHRAARTEVYRALAALDAGDAE